MSPEIWAAVIGGVAGVISAWSTSLLTTRGAAAALARADRRSSQYLAVQVGPALRQFASSCLSVGYDNGYEEGRPAGQNGDCKETVQVEPFKPDEIGGVDWQSLPAPLMVEILTFEEKRQAIEVALSDWHHYFDPPHHSEYFSDRQFKYVGLGIEAVQLGIRLFKETGHTSSLPGADELLQGLLERKAELEKEEKARLQRIAEYRVTLPIFPGVIAEPPSGGG